MRAVSRIDAPADASESTLRPAHQHAQFRDGMKHAEDMPGPVFDHVAHPIAHHWATCEQLRDAWGNAALTALDCRFRAGMPRVPRHPARIWNRRQRGKAER